MNTQLRHHGSDGCPTCRSLPSQERRGWTLKYSSDRFRQSFLHLLFSAWSRRESWQIKGSPTLGEAGVAAGDAVSLATF